jgi:opacity protein-like surface antigen
MNRAVMAAMAAVCFVILSALAAPIYAQTAVPAEPAPTETPVSNRGSFSLTAQAVALPGGGQTVAGTLVGGTYAVTPTVSLRNDDLLAPGNNLQGYFGGVQWFPSNKFLSKTSLNAVQPYVTGSVGIDRIVPASGPSQQHVAFLLGGGLNYKPSSGPTINLVEVRYARLPGLANSTAIVSSGFTLNF